MWDSVNRYRQNVLLPLAWIPHRVTASIAAPHYFNNRSK